MRLTRKLTLALTTSLLAIGATLGTAQVSEAKPATIPCAYGHTCGVDYDGNRYDFFKCGIRYPVALSGPGEYFNNQTPGTAVRWYRADGSPWGVASSGSHNYIDWTDIWWVQAC
ncbi:hypothetical protein ACIRP3_43170 [Streptomyces sp. NPDC101209]|uniref:hypothetical protein n=1 Tax=Streptomyces sp. NPDC101209 TaxID=3366129 RepID=UPI00382B480A